MKIVIKLLITLVLFPIIKLNAQYVSIDTDTIFTVKYVSNKIEINGQNPANITINSYSKILFDISDKSLQGLELYFSTSPDFIFNYSSSPLYKSIIRTGNEGAIGSKYTIDLGAAKEASGTEFNPILYICSKKLPGVYNKIYVYNSNLNRDYLFLNNKTYKKQYIPRTIKSNYANQIGNYFTNVGPVFTYSPFILIDDFNNDKVDDFVFSTQDLFYKGQFLSVGMGAPLYKYLVKNADKSLSINTDNGDMSYPNSKPQTLFHEVQRATFIDLNNDGKKEIIGWGEGYHIRSDTLIPSFAKSVGLVENVDFKGDERSSYNKLMYQKKLTFYEIVNQKLVDKRNLIPNEIPLSESIFGSGGDYDNDGDNDIFVVCNGVWILENNNYKFTAKKLLNSDVLDYFNEGFTRRISTILPYLIDVNLDGYQDLILSLEKNSNEAKPNRIVYVLNNKNKGFDFLNVKDFIPYNNSSSPENYLNYVLSDVYFEDLNRNGTQEVVFCFAKEFSNLAAESPFPSQQIFRVIEIEKNGNLTDLTTKLFEGKTNVITISSKNGGNFFLKNIDNDPEIEIIPNFNTYDPQYFSFFPKDGWYGYWNNYSGFQYFDYTNSKYQIKRMGNIQKIAEERDQSKVKIKTLETFSNSSSFIFHDFDKDNNIELLITGNNSDQILNEISDFQFNSSIGEIKENTGLNVEVDSIAIPSSISASSLNFTLIEDNPYLGLKNNKIYVKSAIDYEVIDNKKITLPIKVTNTKYNTYTLMERVYNVVDVAENLILGTFEEHLGRVSPNPFTSHLIIELPIEFGKEAEMQLFDLHGKNIIPFQKITSGEIIDLNYLSPGAYLVYLTSLDHSQVLPLKIAKIP